ncbi:MAG: hypothetical protein QNI90_15885 [Dinoroseobacter sp.]|nr:hypothetical protein [Dinoroseobacter sp.]
MSLIAHTKMLVYRMPLSDEEPFHFSKVLEHTCASEDELTHSRHFARIGARYRGVSL